MTDCWSSGHPKFAPFSGGTKVIKKIQRKGNQLKNKFSPIYDGPYVVQRVHGIAYEIVCLGDLSLIVIRAHHRQLRP